MNVREKVIEIAKDMWPELDIENISGIVDDNLVDSFDIVTFIGELKDAFDIELGPQDIVPENFNTLEAMVALVEKNK